MATAMAIAIPMAMAMRDGAAGTRGRAAAAAAWLGTGRGLCPAAMAAHAPAPAIATATTASEMICTLSRMTPALALSPRIPPTVCHHENARRATLVAAGSYGVDAAFMSLGRHGCHIHAI